MKTKNIKKTRVLFGIVASLVLVLSLVVVPAMRAAAEEGFAFAVSPMKEKIVLNPGDEYSSSINVYVPPRYDTDIKYQIEVEGFFVDENYSNVYEKCATYCEMVDWVKIDSPTEGRLASGEETRVEYTINVPENAPGGGQYAAIIVKADPWEQENSSDDASDSGDKVASAIQEEKRIAYTIYAEIAGDVKKGGEIVDIDVPSFLLSGKITGSASVKNTGNVHGDATYKLQVFPLFSDEEIYTNEENPATATVLPERTRYEQTAWEQTPSVGIFNVIYTVEFEGTTAQVSKLVIICPIWLLFIIFFVIAMIVIWIVMRVRGRKKETEKSE